MGLTEQKKTNGKIHLRMQDYYLSRTKFRTPQKETCGILVHR